MFIASGWKDYEVIDTGDGEKLERWQDVILRRPDPQAIWPKQRPELWTRADAHYHRSAKGGGEWEFFKKLPERWTVSYGELRFYVHPTGFKHTGLFPEQAVNWDWMAARIREAKRPIRVLNLFGYTGGGNGGLRPRRRAGDACGRGQGHGAVGGGEPPPERHRRNACALDRR